MGVFPGPVQEITPPSFRDGEGQSPGAYCRPCRDFTLHLPKNFFCPHPNISIYFDRRKFLHVYQPAGDRGAGSGAVAEVVRGLQRDPPASGLEDAVAKGI